MEKTIQMRELNSRLLWRMCTYFPRGCQNTIQIRSRHIIQNKNRQNMHAMNKSKGRKHKWNNCFYNNNKKWQSKDREKKEQGRKGIDSMKDNFRTLEHNGKQQKDEIMRLKSRKDQKEKHPLNAHKVIYCSMQVVHREVLFAMNVMRP